MGGAGLGLQQVVATVQAQQAAVGRGFYQRCVVGNGGRIARIGLAAGADAALRVRWVPDAAGVQVDDGQGLAAAAAAPGSGAVVAVKVGGRLRCLAYAGGKTVGKGGAELGLR